MRGEERGPGAPAGQARRIFEHRHLWRLNPTTYRHGIDILVDAALSRLRKIATVIGVADGGRAAAYAITGRTGASMVIVPARHNTGDGTSMQATGEVWCDTEPLRALRGDRGPFLVVADICGTGATLGAVTAALAGFVSPAASICTAALCRNEGAPAGVPDLYLWGVADWVVFPWEPTPAAQPVTPLPRATGIRTT